jgi:hypothetical protein
VALSKICLLHHDHRVSIDPTAKLLKATLGLLEARVPPAVHRWAVEAFMYLTLMPDLKQHLASTGERNKKGKGERECLPPACARRLSSIWRRAGEGGAG